MTLKDSLFNTDTVTLLANKIEQGYPSLEKDAFIMDCVAPFSSLELKERMSVVTKQLYHYLPKDYPQVLDIFTTAFSDTDDSHFVYGSVLEYIELYGCSDEYVEQSLTKLGELTSIFSAEFAIRTFLNKYPEETLKHAMNWVTSNDAHRRRLASEGTRPSLPWAKGITLPYQRTKILLDQLYYDKERYVTRSVANHLNDISKFDPEFVISIVGKWKEKNKQQPSEMDYIIQHSLRTLIKAGHPLALDFLGYKTTVKIGVSEIVISPKKLHIGDTLHFSFTIFPLEDAELIVDYIIYYPSKTIRPSKKVYKLRTLSVQKNKEYLVQGTRNFQHLSTRKMKLGEHEIHIQINGTVWAKKTFMLDD